MATRATAIADAGNAAKPRAGGTHPAQGPEGQTVVRLSGAAQHAYSPSPRPGRTRLRHFGADGWKVAAVHRSRSGDPPTDREGSGLQPTPSVQSQGV